MSASQRRDCDMDLRKGNASSFAVVGELWCTSESCGGAWRGDSWGWLCWQHSLEQQKTENPFRLPCKAFTHHIDKTVIAVKTINVKGTFTYFLKQFVSVTQSRCDTFKFGFSVTRFNPLSFSFWWGRDVGKQLFLLKEVRTELAFCLDFFFFCTSVPRHCCNLSKFFQTPTSNHFKD